MGSKKLKYFLKFGLPVLLVISLLLGFGAVPALAQVGPLDHVTISPANSTLAPGSTSQFTAHAYDAANNLIGGLSFLWNVVAGGGSIDNTGLFIAGSTVGSFPNTVQALAMQNGIARIGTASVTVTTSTGQPPALPHAFYGNLTLGGLPAPVGTVLVARVGGVERGRITATVTGKYGGAGSLDPKLLVQGNITDGSIISFYVNDVLANQTYAFKAGDSTQLNITTGGVPAPAPGTKPGVNKLMSLVRSTVGALGFNNLVSGQWSVKVGDKTVEIKLFTGVLQAISTTSVSILPTGQTNPLTFALTTDTVMRGADGFKIGKPAAVVTVDGTTSLVAHLPVAKGEKGTFPGSAMDDDHGNGNNNDRGQGNKGKTSPPFGNAWGNSKNKDKHD